MTFQEAIEQVLLGRAVSRYAWQDADLLLTLANPGQPGLLQARGEQGAQVHVPWRLADSDMAAEDWFVVASVN
jgi:hypothetical protein